MNTPRTPKRASIDPSKFTATGTFYNNVTPQTAANLGFVVVAFGHLEDAMISVFRAILGIENRDFSPLAFRSLNSNSARIALMKQVLQNAQEHTNTSTEFDEVIDEFSALSTIRNKLVHGLWTMNNANIPYLTNADGKPGSGMMSRKVETAEFQDFLSRCNALITKAGAVSMSECRRLNAQLLKRHQEALKPEG